MFGDDSFAGIEDLFNQLSSRRQHSNQTQAQNLLGVIESKQQTILIFDLSGKKVLSVEIKDNIETNEYGERISAGQKALTIEFEDSEVLRYDIPKALAKRKVNYTFTNGILEVFLNK
jgi:HSP20 family molecular chaperone IbpA